MTILSCLSWINKTNTLFYIASLWIYVYINMCLIVDIFIKYFKLQYYEWLYGRVSPYTSFIYGSPLPLAGALLKIGCLPGAIFLRRSSASVFRRASAGAQWRERLWTGSFGAAPGAEWDTHDTSSCLQLVLKSPNTDDSFTHFSGIMFVFAKWSVSKQLWIICRHFP